MQGKQISLFEPAIGIRGGRVCRQGGRRMLEVLQRLPTVTIPHELDIQQQVISYFFLLHMFSCNFLFHFRDKREANK